jgi:hypothetical protein
MTVEGMAADGVAKEFYLIVELLPQSRFLAEGGANVVFAGITKQPVCSGTHITRTMHTTPELLRATAAQ